MSSRSSGLGAGRPPVPVRSAPLRWLAYVTLGIAVTHLVFGAIVRISGSGMGCGDNWPKCYGHWFPPLDQPTLVIEWTHRLLAALLITAVVALAITAWTRREEFGVGGPMGMLRAATLAAAVVVVTALFGAVTVWLGNVWYATVGHWLLAATLLASLAAAVIRAGGLGGTSARRAITSTRTRRAAAAAAGVALLAILLGGMTAKYPGANVACAGFPLCRGGIIDSPAQHIQLTHRFIAYILAVDIIALAIGIARRRESAVVVRTARIALGLVILQVIIAAAMVELHLPAELRSLHQAVGVGIWLTLFTLAYLARLAPRAAAAMDGAAPEAEPAAAAAPGARL